MNTEEVHVVASVNEALAILALLSIDAPQVDLGRTKYGGLGIRHPRAPDAYEQLKRLLDDNVVVPSSLVRIVLAETMVRIDVISVVKQSPDLTL